MSLYFRWPSIFDTRRDLVRRYAFLPALVSWCFLGYFPFLVDLSLWTHAPNWNSPLRKQTQAGKQTSRTAIIEKKWLATVKRLACGQGLGKRVSGREKTQSFSFSPHFRPRRSSHAKESYHKSVHSLQASSQFEEVARGHASRSRLLRVVNGGLAGRQNTV